MARIYSQDVGDKELKQLHECMLEILDDFVDICEENGLKYYLSGGTLLGAVRHGGFIPWDDDLDVVMPRTDYEKFCNIVSTRDKTNFYFQCNDNDPGYWALYGKYKKAGTEINESSIQHLNVDKGIFIDVFPLDDTNLKNTKAVYRASKRVKFLSKCIETKVGIGSTYKRWDKRIVRFLLKPFTIKLLTHIRHRIVIRENNPDNRYYINYGTYYSTEKAIFPQEYYGEGLMVQFEKRQCRVPIEWDLILTKVYGDYMTPPPEEKRKMTHNPVYIDFGEG